ncbi:MAG: hypothetical protein N838_08855 [Thiohalocapsa sp. PB-PSB1]|nr:MAG: hypothetical protein N838_08855 [Thiohalocapsa sp. PB-PSB1]HCS89215.1 hypothetical protein [Chromatiaceae bacterium]
MTGPRTRHLRLSRKFVQTFSVAALSAALLTAPPAALAASDAAALERRVAALEAELELAKRELAAAQNAASEAELKSAELEADLEQAGNPQADKITLGPVTIGGAMRVNYVLGSYPGNADGPSRGGNGGNFELDTFRINMDLNYKQLVGKFEYRWYNGYNFIHTGWLGWDFDNGSQLQVGVNRVPFGPGPYGISQSWFFDQHYYVGLADDPDLGIQYVTSLGNWDLDFAYYVSSEWDGNGTSQDSARYTYDAVEWLSAIEENGDLIAAPPNGFSERNQFNLRAIYGFDDIQVPTAIGVSLLYGQLKGRRTDDGDRWAASLHMKNNWNNWLLATQLTKYKYNIDADNPWGTDALVPMGAYDFAWPVAADAWIPAASLSYLYEANRIPWLDSVRPYLEYSTIVKQDSDYSDSELWVLGAAWARQGWYIYTDLAYANGNYFVGDDGDNYSNIFRGVGDFGVDGNRKWNYRLNLNFGYYF